MTSCRYSTSSWHILEETYCNRQFPLHKEKIRQTNCSPNWKKVTRHCARTSSLVLQYTIRVFYITSNDKLPPQQLLMANPRGNIDNLLTHGTRGKRKHRQPAYDGCHLEFEKHIASHRLHTKDDVLGSPNPNQRFPIFIGSGMFKCFMIASCKGRNRKQDGHNNNNMLVKNLQDHILHRINNTATYQLGVDFIETTQRFFRPLNLSRISALAHAHLEFCNNQIHLFPFASASGREGTKGRLGTDTAQER